MRIVGYVREPADGSRPAYTQQEELRRHASDHGDQLVSVCIDPHLPGRPPARDGYLGVLGVVASGAVDAVLVPGVETLSSDQIVQEIMIWDLQARGIRVVSTDPSDQPLLDRTEPPSASRMLIRDVLDRVGDHARTLRSRQPDSPSPLPDADVLVHIIEADQGEAGRHQPDVEESRVVPRWADGG